MIGEDEVPADEGGINPIPGVDDETAGKDEAEEQEGDTESKKAKEAQVKKEDVRHVRIFEYDLFNYKKIKAQDFQHLFKPDEYFSTIREELENNRWGKYNEGFYRIVKENKEAPKNTYIYKIIKGAHTFEIQFNQKGFLFKTEGDTPAYHETLALHPKGDRLMMILSKDEGMQYLHFTLDVSKKIFK